MHISFWKFWTLFWQPFKWNIDVITINEQSAVHRSFAVADNLGEVSAKAQVLMLSGMQNILSLISYLLWT